MNKINKIFTILVLTAILPAIIFLSCAQKTSDNNNHSENSENNPTSVETVEIVENKDIPAAKPEESLELSEENIAEETGYKDGFVFTSNGVPVYLGEYTERILKELEPASDCYEYESCSFSGIAKIYSYNGFEISTYLKNPDNNDRVYSITFEDDSISTPEGLYIGGTFDNMTSVYGENYIFNPDIPGYYKYNKNGTDLAFNIDNGIIISISYQVADMYD